MKYDIDAYNQAIVKSETDMLLYNIGRLHNNQQPHFMMLSSISQARTFTANAGFQWSQVASTINPFTAVSKVIGGAASATTTTITGNQPSSGDTWQAGPFTSGTAESPTITFVPVQGPDFAQRFESPMRGPFSLFLEDKWWAGSQPDYDLLVRLFGQSLYLFHVDDLQNKCEIKANGKRDGSVLYVNRRYDKQRDSSDTTGINNPDFYYDAFSECMKRIVGDQNLNISLIDGHNRVPTDVAEDPKASDAISALEKSFEWNRQDGKYRLSTPVKIPALFDYDPQYETAHTRIPDTKSVNEPLATLVAFRFRA